MKRFFEKLIKLIFIQDKAHVAFVKPIGGFVKIVISIRNGT